MTGTAHKYGHNVSHLTALLMADGAQGPHLRPLVLEQPRGGPMTFYYVRAENPKLVLGQVDHSYTDVSVVQREIIEAHGKWGFPTKQQLEAAFPHGEITARIRTENNAGT